MLGRKKLVIALLTLPALASFSSRASESVKLDRLPIEANASDHLVSLQRGAHAYVNYCFGCHSASYMRYNRLRDLGLTEQQIKSNLIFADVKVGDLMTNAMDRRSAKEWFGTAPPDLTVIARARSSGAGSGGGWASSLFRRASRAPAPAPRVEQRGVSQCGHAARALPAPGSAGAEDGGADPSRRPQRAGAQARAREAGNSLPARVQPDGGRSRELPGVYGRTLQAVPR